MNPQIVINDISPLLQSQCKVWGSFSKCLTGCAFIAETSSSGCQQTNKAINEAQQIHLSVSYNRSKNYIEKNRQRGLIKHLKSYKIS